MELITPIQSQNARRLLTWSQEDLASKATLGVQTIRNFERGERIHSALGYLTPEQMEQKAA